MERTQFKRLFEPISIGLMQSKNRIVMPPMGTGYAAEKGHVSQRLIGYYAARAKGGTGVIIVEGTAPDVQCSGTGSQLSIGDESYIAGLGQLVKIIHQYGAKAALQLMHAGWEIREGQLVQIAPSPVVVPMRMVGISGQLPHELSIDEIGQRVRWFAAAARRAREAGFDGVEIHGAHQYPLASFLSSATNMRQDRYGGTVKNKARFLIEVIQAIREEAGSDYPVWPRLNAHEYGVDKGVTIEETKEVVPLLIDAGAQAIHVSAYGVGSYVTKAPMSDTPGFLVPLAEEIRKVTNIPLIAVGRLGPEIGEQILEEGKADLIAMGRRLMADPDLPNKAAEGRLGEINPCIGCMECNERGRIEGEGVRCTINAAMGREGEHRIEPVAKAKRVVVVGGGPAGMEAARLAAQRGHHVTLCEKELRLGGQLNLAALPPEKGDPGTG
jgi:2,4-dienoyl-CoA reductase-like NADH-dependent reductase (Old Yellow Enzyme family)